MGPIGDEALSETNRPSENIPVPYALENEMAPRHAYYPEYPGYYSGQQVPEGTDWERIAKLLWQRKLWILATVVLGTAIGLGVSRLLPREYETFTRIWLEEQQNTGGGTTSSGQLLQGEGWADVIQSRAVLVPVVDDLALQVEVLSPAGLERSDIGRVETGPELVSGIYTLTVHSDGTWSLDLDGQGRVETGGPSQAVGTSVGFSWLPPPALLETAREIRLSLSSQREAVFKLAGGLNIRYNPNASIIRASLTWKDRDEAAPILNTLADRFIQVANDLKKQKIREEVQMLNQQTAFTEERLVSAEYALENHRIAAITEPSEPMVAPLPTGGAATSQRDPLFDTFQQNKLQADQLQYDLDQLRQIERSVLSGAEPNLLALQLVPSVGQSAELKAAIADLENKEAEKRTLLYEYTEEFPQVAQLTGEIQDLQERILPAALARLQREMQNQIDLLERQVEARSAQLREIPTRTIRGARLQREVDHAATLHNNLLLRLKQAELVEATAGPGIQVLDPAWPPGTPLGEKPGRIILLFAMGSFGLGIAGVLVFDMLDKRIRYPDQVTTSLGLPVLGVVPRLEAAPHPASPTAAIAVESFRGLRTQIAHSDGNVEGITLVTSPAPREGKSMVSANLAISYATAGYRTLLFDGDTRRGRAQEMFGLERSPGLTDYLMERATLEEIVQETSVQNLKLVARGAPGGFNADLLESDRMQDLMSTLRGRFDVIVIDGPPLAAGADVLMLGQRSDKVVVVLRAGATKEDLARAKLETLGNVQLPIVGAVLNAMPKSSPYYEYYVNYYYADVEVAS